MTYPALSTDIRDENIRDTPGHVIPFTDAMEKLRQKMNTPVIPNQFVVDLPETFLVRETIKTFPNHFQHIDQTTKDAMFIDHLRCRSPQFNIE
jgi:hypothetical protein